MHRNDTFPRRRAHLPRRSDRGADRRRPPGLVNEVVLILAVEFFQRALQLSYESALEILYLAAAIALVSGGLYLIGRRSS